MGKLTENGVRWGSVGRTGLPIAGDFLVRMGGAMALVSVVARFGVVAVAAYGIGTKAIYFATMGFYAIRQAATIHASRVAGEGRDESGAIGKQALVLGLGAGCAAAVTYGAGAAWIMAAFTGRAEVAEVGAGFLHWVGLYLIPLSGVLALSGVLMAGRSASRLFLVTLAGTLLLPPLAYGLSTATALHLTGIWLAMGVSAAIQLALVLRLWMTAAP
jgi:Na+-driven multidrug efflux pump